MLFHKDIICYNAGMVKKISVVVPIYNEEAGVREFLDGQLLPEIEKWGYATEVILVNDGSRDGTVEEIKKSEMMKQKETKLVCFTKNFGKEMALTAGLHVATGDAVVMIDADGQHPVGEIATMIKRWEQGARVVTAVAKDKKTAHGMGSKVFYWLMKKLGNKSFQPGAMDFRLVDREVAEGFKMFTERNRITRGLIDWLGYEQEYIEVKMRGRKNGKPTYTTRMLVRLAVDSLVSTSRTPLVIFGWLGLMITLLSGMLGVFVLVQQYILGDPLGLDWSGAVAMSIFVSFLVGLVLISQAMTALYVSQIHVETKNRPLYVIDKRKSMGM